MKAELNFDKKYLIDASVLIAGSFENQPKAMEILAAESPIYTIEFMFIEATNVLKSKAVELALAQKLLNNLSLPPFVKLPLLPIDLETAFRIATDFKVSVYDALYHAVAMKLFLTFLTLDKDYYAKTKAAGWVELLE